MNDLNNYAKLKAISQHKRIPLTCRAHHKMLPHARVLSGLRLRGYVSSLQAFALAPVGDDAPLVVRSCTDPRSERQQKSVLTELQNHMEEYIQDCVSAGTAPQIWIANQSAFRHWQAIADRYVSDSDLSKLSQILQYLTQRYHYAGSQSFLPLSRVLKTHWATGQPQYYDENLHTWQYWMTANPVKPLEYYWQQHPFSNVPPRLEAYFNDQKGQNRRMELGEKIVQQRAQQLQSLIQRFRQHAPSLITAFPFWWQQELEYFSGFIRSRRSNPKDSTVVAAHKLEEREFCQENYLADLRRDDSAIFYASVLDGHSLEGVVRACDGRSLRLQCTQHTIRARAGDSLSLRSDPGIQFRVLDREHHPDGLQITLEKKFGSFYTKSGKRLQLIPSSTGWGFKARRRENLSKKLHQRGWIHKEEV